MASKKDLALTRWNAPGYAGFKNWLQDIKPHIKHDDGLFHPLQLEQWQTDILRDALAVDERGNFSHNIIMTCMPRRHSKSTMWQLVILWLVMSRENQNIIALPCTDDHGLRTMFKPMAGIISHTPKLSPHFKVFPSRGTIQFDEMGGSITIVAPNPASAFGDKVSVLWTSDMHISPDLRPFNAFLAGLMDSKNSIVLIDTNVDVIGGPVHSLQVEAAENPRIYSKHLEYKDFEEYCEKAPRWIDRNTAATNRAVTLDAEFQRDTLGKRGSGVHDLFPSDVLEKCKDSYTMPVSAEALKELVGGRQYIVTGGLDRAKKLWGGDGTIWTVTLKVASISGEPHVYVLNQKAIAPNTAAEIKKAILEDHERYTLTNVTMEDYETHDITPWLDSQKIPNESVSATNTRQNSAFLEMHRVAKEGRLHIPTNAPLITEMRTFIYSESKTGKFQFGSSNKRNFPDDRVYSACWSIFAARNAVLSMYRIGNILCRNKSPKKSLCFLLGGSLELVCKTGCHAYSQVEKMHQHYAALTLQETDIPNFFSSYVKLDGARISQAV
ncbi:hypothetical protein [Fundidesulfovibrio putealis]|uniref:hypothetical protein n=1 Tax=Fundidesulfovibrio putealis TaxID=270496 RepID=UPI0004087B62|nr:hypothetical protein [Fundidesulfovibrio putealis]